MMLQVFNRTPSSTGLFSSPLQRNSVVHLPSVATSSQDSFCKRVVSFAGQKDEESSASAQKRGSKLPSPVPSRLFLNLLASTNAFHQIGASASPSSSSDSRAQNEIAPYYQKGNDPFNYWETPNAEPFKHVPLAQTESDLDILASTSQNHYGFANQHARDTYYTMGLLQELYRPHVNSISQAHSILEGKGYQSSPGYRPQTPVSNLSVLSSGSCNAIWEKNTSPKPARFALLLGNGRDFTTSLSGMQDMLQQLYGLNADQIKKYRNVKTEDFDAGIHHLAAQVQQAQQKGLKPEILIYYAGHGLLENKDGHHHLNLKEGEAQGGLMTAKGYISENEVKALIRNHLPQANTLLILDACFSGSWTA